MCIFRHPSGSTQLYEFPAKQILYRLIDLQRLHLLQHCLFLFTSITLVWKSMFLNAACPYVHLSVIKQWSYLSCIVFLTEILSEELWAEFSRCRNTCLCLLHTLQLFWFPELSMKGILGMLTSDPHSDCKAEILTTNLRFCICCIWSFLYMYLFELSKIYMLNAQNNI